METHSSLIALKSDVISVMTGNVCV